MSEATHDLLDDLHEDLLTPGEIAMIYRVPVPTLRQWKRRGHLEPCGPRLPGPTPVPGDRRAAGGGEGRSERATAVETEEQRP